MFLHSGASLHGHEYSSRHSASTPQSTQNLRAPLLRSAFPPPKQHARTIDGAIAPVLRQRPVSDYMPRGPSAVVRFREPQDDHDPTPTPATDDETASESELSDTALSIDGAIAARPSTHRRRPRVPRKCTTYWLGYPTPRIIGKTKVVQKVFLPRLLLQLQRVSEDGRSQPVLEVYPASRIAGPIVTPRLAKRFPEIFGVKRHLGYDDIVLVRRDDSDLAGDESENEESLEKRNILAVYSPLKHSDEAEIVLDDGSIWVARPLTNGSYDFVHTDAEGNITTARWAKRHAAVVSPTSVSMDPSTPSVTAPQTRYTFSIINPLTRRHPVMATLTPSALDVQDTYTSVRPSHSRHRPVARLGRSFSMTSSSPSLVHSIPNSPSTPSSPSISAVSESDSAVGIPPTPDRVLGTHRTVHQIDDSTKMLISVTALWVALRSGWSQSYTPPGSGSSSNHTHESDTAVPTTFSSPRSNRSRRNTWTTRSRSSSTSEPAVRPGADSPLAVGGESPRLGLRKRYSMPARPHLHPTAAGKDGEREKEAQSTPVASRTSTPVPGVSSSAGNTRPRRATSTGAAFMQRHLQEASSLLSAPDGGGSVDPSPPALASSSSSSRPLSLPGSIPLPPMPASATTAGTETTTTSHREAAATPGQARTAPETVAASPQPPRREKERDKDRDREKTGILIFRRAAGPNQEGARKRLQDGEAGGSSDPAPGAAGTGGGNRCRRVRSRLARWIHKLGSASSSP